MHQDIRQVAGYARLKRVRAELGITDGRNIDCLIIHPDMNEGLDLEKVDDLNNTFSLEAIHNSFTDAKNQIQAYHKVYKIGVSLPLVE